jgi:preprotein translocase SecF subunit
VIQKVKGALGDAVTYRRIEVVGPRISGEFVQRGTIAVVLSIVVVLVYLWFRFEWQFAIGATAATMHDIVLTIGMFAGLQLDFDLSSIAAILTIVGYSLNDTVVVYDRIRENLRRYKRMPLPQLLDLSINETLSRTTLTSLTTLIALVSLYLFGGEVIRSFTLAMIFGVIVGTYSSIYIAAPFLIYMNLRPSTLVEETPEKEAPAGSRA